MPRRDRPDGGFTLAEVLVAMSVFSILVTVALGLVLRTTGLLASNDRRVVAANLADRQIESARSQRAVDIPDGLTTRTETVGGVTYTVKQTATYVPSDATSSVCTASAAGLAYKLVTVTVTWPGMGRVKAVRADTLKAVGIGTDGLDTASGSVAVSVVGASGAAVSDVVVTLSPGGATTTTGEDGCAVFTSLAPGAYTAAVDTGGYVGTTNAQASTLTSLGVSAGTIARGTLLYDTARSAQLVLTGPTGFTAPAGVRTVLRSSYVSETVYPVCTGAAVGCVTALPGTAEHLFPTVYDVWAGTCADVKTVSGAVTTVDLAPAASDGTTVQVRTGSVLVDVRSLLGTSLTGRVVTATHAADAAGLGQRCTTGETFTLPATTAGGVGVLLPAGTWTFTVPNGVAPVTASLDTSGPKTVVLTVTA
ncbi:prepilin-type N-terminal cleavage/methylation domain-containing protein [Kineosporia sp. R_H_3]|uniref:prepilin-type N-terminal cleavage/methylation domain-containing protein n=1 Tax=Kineosporia sp. R_H_3 TaxID=1961848 RepID=UPI0013043393|nr:prepilin-type N-terminal cleavage/methylation domain-containing protein [Kineosporia sp. R_H_3]